MRLDHIRLMQGVVLGTIVLVWGCGGVSERRGVKKGVEWKLRMRIVQTNTYTKDGLLDTSYAMDYFAVGAVTDSVRSFTQRKYERGKLVDEQDFTIVGKNAERELNSEIVRKYDVAGNKVAETRIMLKDTVLKNFYQYNKHGQPLQQLLIDEVPGIGKDSVSFIFIYDRHGRKTGTIISAKGRQKREVRMISYDNGVKSSEFLIGPEGDTLENLRYEHDGALVKEISLLQTPNGSDTVWYRGELIMESIRHDQVRGKREKSIYTYDARGNETSSFYYEAPL